MRPTILLLILIAIGGCSHPAQHYSKSFVEWDARSDAENVAGERCNNKYKLIPGRSGFLSEDYECLAASPVSAIPSQQDRPFPTKSAAAKAYAAYEENICRKLIDVCNGISPTTFPPDGVEKLVCRPANQGATRCTFEIRDRHCKAQFIRSPSSTDGWIVAFRNRVPKGPDITCK